MSKARVLKETLHCLPLRERGLPESPSAVARSRKRGLLITAMLAFAAMLAQALGLI